MEVVSARAHSLENLPGDAAMPRASSRMALGSSDLFGPIPCGQWRLGKAKMGKAEQGSTIDTIGSLLSLLVGFWWSQSSVASLLQRTSIPVNNT